MKREGWDTDWIIFSGKTRRGAIIFLILFILAGVMARYLFSSFSSNKAEVTYFSVLESDPIRLDTLRNNKKPSFIQQKKKKSFTIPTESFDPNDLKSEDWVEMGFSAKQAASILNFKEKIGGFKSKMDVAKVYSISDEVFEQLSPLMNLPDSLPQAAKKKWQNNPINFNRASKSALQRIKGVGPFYAARIVEYRDRLGGFYDMKQLLEINQMPPDLAEDIKQQVAELNAADLIRMDLNTVELGDLSRHPYIRISVAREIISVRELMSGYNEVEELLRLETIDAALYEKLKHYFTVQ